MKFSNFVGPNDYGYTHRALKFWAMFTIIYRVDGDSAFTPFICEMILVSE